MSIASCKTAQKAVYNDYSTLSFAKPPVLVKPVVAELEIGARTTIAQTYTNTSLEPARESTLAQFCRDQSCDVVVQPRFSIETETYDEKSTKNKVSVKLTGFPGTYKNIRNYEPKDSAYFNTNVLPLARSTTYTPQSNTEVVKPKTRKAGWLVTGGILVATALILLILL